MMETISRHRIIIIVIVVLVGFGLWYGISGSGSAPQTLTTTDATTEDSDLVASLIQLKSIALTGTIFSDPVFQSLKDFGVDIVAEPVGRPNPFAPIIFTPSVNTASNQQASIFAPVKR